MGKQAGSLAELLKQFEANLLSDWLKEQAKTHSSRKGLISEIEIKQQSTEFLNLFMKASQNHNEDTSGSDWNDMRSFLESLSRTRSQQGFNSSETAFFIFSFKQPFFKCMQQELNESTHLVGHILSASALLDQLGLFTIEVYQKAREEIIRRQQEEMLELSTPVVKLWEGVLALPMIGTLDSNRTQIVMESLLQKIVETGAETAIIDITGVPNVDTLVAQHLLKTITAARLMGAECIISGIRPQIAQTIVHLGVNLQGIKTKASLADAFQLALSFKQTKLANIN